MKFREKKNTDETSAQHLPFGNFKFIFFLKIVAKSLDYIISHNKFDKMMLNQV